MVQWRRTGRLCRVEEVGLDGDFLRGAGLSVSGAAALLLGLADLGAGNTGVGRRRWAAGTAIVRGVLIPWGVLRPQTPGIIWETKKLSGEGARLRGGADHRAAVEDERQPDQRARPRRAAGPKGSWETSTRIRKIIVRRDVLQMRWSRALRPLATLARA